MSNISYPFSAWLGLGGNLGDPVASMSKALQMLDARADTHVGAVSKLYRTPPWGKTDQSWFYNSCAFIETDLTPCALIEACLAIETDMKRERNERWGPRTLDIDILAMEKQEGGLIRLDEERLILPHPRMMLRAFVLMPLADIAPDLQIEGQSIKSAAYIAAQDVDAQGIEIADTNQDWWR